LPNLFFIGVIVNFSLVILLFKGAHFSLVDLLGSV
jgi:hypothetical protein